MLVSGSLSVISCLLTSTHHAGDVHAARAANAWDGIRSHFPTPIAVALHRT